MTSKGLLGQRGRYIALLLLGAVGAHAGTISHSVVVPEPASMVLIGSSILSIGLLLRRKQRKP